MSWWGWSFFFFWFLPPVCTDFTAFLVKQYIRQANRVFKYQNLEESLQDKRLSALKEPWWTLYGACVVSRVLSVNRQHHWHFQKWCPGLHMCNHKYLIVVSLCSALRTDPLYGHIRRRYLPYSPVMHETIKTFRREKNPLFHSERKRKWNHLRSQLKRAVLNNCADAGVALALQVSERIVTTERPTFQKRVWKASKLEQITSLRHTGFIKVQRGELFGSIRHSGYGFFLTC